MFVWQGGILTIIYFTPILFLISFAVLIISLPVILLYGKTIQKYDGIFPVDSLSVIERLF